MKDPEFSSNRRQSLQKFLLRLGVSDTRNLDWDHLDRALMHPSLDQERNNDRLELLGDAVLRLMVTNFLYRTYPDLSVGDLSAVRSDLISDAHLADLADLYGFERFLQMGASAQQDPRGRSRRLADAFEAVFGALYLSWDAEVFPRLSGWLEPHLRRRTEKILQDPMRHNAKAALQELTQSLWGILPEYRLIESQLHPPQFQVQAWFQDRCWGEGSGSSKKAAEVAAAAVAYQALRSSTPRSLSS
jgi:ribonuclease-3